MNKLLPLILMLAACSPMPHTKVAGLDNLKTTVHEIENVIPVCAEKVGVPLMLTPLVTPSACSWISFKDWTCDIYVFPGDAINLEHEKLHCQGYDHFGTIQRGFDRWKEYQLAIQK